MIHFSSADPGSGFAFKSNGSQALGKRGVITGQENKFEERGKGVVNKGKRKREGEVKERVDDIKIKFYRNKIA